MAVIAYTDRDEHSIGNMRRVTGRFVGPAATLGHIVTGLQTLYNVQVIPLNTNASYSNKVAKNAESGTADFAWGQPAATAPGSFYASGLVNASVYQFEAIGV